jgi:GlcNAc-P-P-Und epimerase
VPNITSVLITGGSGFIGRHVIERLKSRGLDVFNFDLNPCPDSGSLSGEVVGDICDEAATERAFAMARPDVVLHLAAEVEVHPDLHIGHYRANYIGTRTILNVSAEYPLERFIHVSTQYVCRPGYAPSGDDDYLPHTAYGQSKAFSEEIVRSRPDIPWCIVRPTTIWGPGDRKYRADYYQALARGFYLHPRSGDAQRSMTYVSNAVLQFLQILDAPVQNIRHRTIYVGDPVQPLSNYVDALSLALRGKTAHRSPRWFLRVMAAVGDSALPVQIPLSLHRYEGMTQDYNVDLGPIDELGSRNGMANIHDAAEELAQSLRNELEENVPKTVTPNK